MEPKRKLDFELPAYKYARIQDYFSDPEKVPDNNLLSHIQSALDQIQRAPASAGHLYPKALSAVIVWSELSEKQSRETIQKVYQICRKIILQTSKFHQNEEGIATITLDLTKIPLTRTQVDLLRFESNWARECFERLANKADCTVPIPAINVHQYQVIAKYILDEPTEIPPHEMPLYLDISNLLATPSFAAFVAEKLRTNIRTMSLDMVLIFYEGLQLVTSRYKQSLINDCLLRVSFIPMEMIKRLESDYELTIDSRKIVINEKNSQGQTDPMHSLISIRMAINEGHLDQAKQLFKELGDYKQKSVGDLLAFRILALENRLPLEAISRLDRAIMKEQGGVPRLIKEGIEFLNVHAKRYFQLENYKNALKLAQQAALKDPDCPETLYRIAKIYDYTEKPADEVIGMLEHALLANNAFHKARLYLAKMLEKKGKFQEAIAECSRLIQSNYKISKVYGYRGTIYFNMGRYNEAIHDYKAQSALDRNSIEPYMSLAECYIEQENYTEALKCLTKVEKMKGPNDETRGLRLLIPDELQEIPSTQDDVDDLF